MNRRHVAAIAVCFPLAVGFVFLAWRIFTLGLADYWAIAVPARALVWRSQQPDALNQAAEEQLAAKNYVPAQRLARSAIAAYPLDGTGYRVLAEIADRAGDRKRALQLWRITSTRSPRDLTTHGKLAEYALKAGNVDEALHQFDLIMRLKPAIEHDLLPRIVKLAEFPEADPALVRILAKRTPWRSQFLSTLAGHAHDSAAVSRIFGALQDSTSLSAEERQYWIDRQINDHDWTSAYVDWVSTLPVAERSALGNLFDGHFKFPASGTGFGWRISPVAGVDVRTVALSSENALMVEFAGMRTPSAGIEQLIVLSPGHYVLRGRAQANGLDTERGLQWILTCAEGQQIIMTSPLLVGSQPWREFATPFEVPGDRCGGQWLRLQVGAPYMIGGRAGYANLSVDRETEAAGPSQDEF